MKMDLLVGSVVSYQPTWEARERFVCLSKLLSFFHHGLVVTVSFISIQAFLALGGLKSIAHEATGF
jgi:hypothetical protein